MVVGGGDSGGGLYVCVLHGSVLLTKREPDPKNVKLIAALKPETCFLSEIYALVVFTCVGFLFALKRQTRSFRHGQ